MNKLLKYLLIGLFVAILIVGGIFLCEHVRSPENLKNRSIPGGNDLVENFKSIPNETGTFTLIRNGVSETFHPFIPLLPGKCYENGTIVEDNVTFYPFIIVGPDRCYANGTIVNENEDFYPFLLFGPCRSHANYTIVGENET